MNLQATFQRLYPENSVGGQCFAFCHKLVDFPLVGDYIGQKIKDMNAFGIPIGKLDTIKVGDVILQNYPVFGHGSIVNDIIGSNLQLTESNYKLNLRVHHTRQISINDKNILGVFRGSPKYPVPAPDVPPTPAYNIPLRVKLVFNHQPDWKSLTKHANNIVNWFYQHSNGHILPVVDWTYANLNNYDVVIQPDTFGQNPVKIIKEAWFDQNVLPLAQSFQAVVFVIPKSEWVDSVINDPSQIELGFAYKSGIPMKAMVALDEFDDYAPYYPDLGGFAKYVCHELMHNLYAVCANDKVVPGGDYTHNHFYGQNGSAMQPEDCFQDLNYETLSSLIPR